MIARPLRPLLCFLLLAAAACGRSAPSVARTPEPPKGSAARDDAPSGQTRGQLALVRAPPPRCSARGRPKLLVQRAIFELERGEDERALACADEALRLAPRLVAALRLRGEALAELGRFDEARLAYARSLAVEPDDAETLRGAADLYVMQLPSERATLELGLEYALRGLRGARARSDLQAALLLLVAAAENDLGESRQALAYAERALAVRADDLDAAYERGVALYELCRFEEARDALERVRAGRPDDAWTLHYLGLVAERAGHGRHAEELERRARSLAPDEFRAGTSIDPASFTAEVRRALAALPERERKSVADVPVEIADVPALDDLTALDPPLSPSILGLFRGPSQGEPCLPEEGPRCRSIVLYRVNLARFARSRADLAEQVRVTLLHEIGHLQGETEDELRARGLE
ncbi:MAG TPA: metallopeptidase family protein [Anaeromyxobacteraceae bacterium]|nr:metallopeptidase family protein [Anaeromyxobacteraceae bacterium]